MVDSVSTNRVHQSFPVRDIVLHSFDPRPSPDFSPRLQDKIWEWPGDEGMSAPQTICVQTTCDVTS